jgi:hypothetical protein
LDFFAIANLLDLLEATLGLLTLDGCAATFFCCGAGGFAPATLSGTYGVAAAKSSRGVGIAPRLGVRMTGFLATLFIVKYHNMPLCVALGEFAAILLIDVRPS